MDIILNDHEARVLGCLMEKSMSTPDYYPLSLNALTNACNQKSNRDPVVRWDQQTVENSAGTLVEKGLVHCSTIGRVPKYEETFTRQSNIVAAEAAVLCVLLLRGPQTPGAIRSRCNRMATTEDVATIQATLDRLGEWGYVRRLERLPGHKESRYMHRFCPVIHEDDATDRPTAVSPVTDDNERLRRLETDLQRMRDKVDDLSAAFESFRQQFD